MKKRITGYQVRTKDLQGICFSHHSFDTCKKYCREDCVIVSTYAKTYGIKIRIFWQKHMRLFHWDKYANVFNMFNLHIGCEKLCRDAMDEVVYRP